jgi:hypothetical protein
MVRYRIESGGLMETHRAVLPHDVSLHSDAPHDQAYTSAQAGDFVFVGYEQRMTVLAYRLADLSLVGRLDIGPQSQTPIFDGPPELVAARRGKDYLLFMPQYTGNATTVLTWNPEAGATAFPALAGLTAHRDGATVRLSWNLIPDTATWRIERRSLLQGQWGGWQPAGEASGGSVSWTDSQATATPVAYRVRAQGPGACLSDWSKTFYVR